jgi:hypothetical protein
MLKLPGVIESHYLTHFNATKYSQDWWGALCYLAMDAPGLVTTVLAATVLPELWNTGLEGCVIMTTTTTAVLVIHLALMLLLKPQAYITNRGPITTAVRVLYMLSAITRGLQHCSTVTKWVDGIEMESPLSAFLWRTGIIALLWHGSAFRLPFWQHLYMQSIAAMAYTLFLAEDVCKTLDSIQHGARTVTAAQRVLQAGSVVWELAAFLVTGNEQLLLDPSLTYGLHHNNTASLPVQPLGGNTLGAPVCVNGSSSVGSSSSSSDSLAVLQQQACVHAVRWWQVLLGHVLLSAVLYFLELRDRQRWLQKTYGHLLTGSDPQQQLQQQEQQQEEQHWQMLQQLGQPARQQ